MGTVARTKLHRLRERLAQEFEDILNTGEPLLDNEGNPIVISGKPVFKRPSPAMYNTIRQFLRDNGIDRDPLDIDPEKPPVTDALPFVEDLQELDGLPAHLQIQSDARLQTEDPEGF